MAGDPRASEGEVSDQTFAVVAVPEHLTQQVVAYVQSLLDADDDTSGYMIAGVGSAVGGTGVLSEKIHHTNCIWKQTGTKGWDVDCSD